ncbi:cadmium-translocating P-type ATPase [Erysipelotrichaceae bacterium I46]|uniref:heavy metal translocating P-type ATPase n=1 Tax=Clostridium innocuum TaxID=1522 RepID=UPI00080C700A|nr:heavy metal translocating P-type ATPase [[Clostridium] innocuum]ANU68761.1 cadmium-translocating P-type ATPase [Erysipelotrichaceae bacterium I46]ASU18810.1 cadmium-translocating P-type ATPase [[Clostridium] innocuum]QQR27351.1 cadmium-translocating P-type ATPase [[Clostridium] innocuum]
MERIYILDELDCANCAMKIERHVGKIKGVKECSVDFVSKRMFVDMEHEGIEAVLKETVQAIEPDVILRRKDDKKAASAGKQGASGKAGHPEAEKHHSAQEDCGCKKAHHHDHADCACAHTDGHDHHDACNGSHAHENDGHHHHEGCACGHDHAHEAHEDREIQGALKLYVKNLDCANCANKIEAYVRKMDNIKDASMNFSQGVLFVELQDASRSEDTIKAIMAVIPTLEDGVTVELEKTTEEEKPSRMFSFQENARLYLGILLFAAAVVLEAQSWSVWLFLAAYVMAGGKVVYIALRNILKGEVFDENFLMSVATIGALAIGSYEEAVAVMIFYEIGEMFQSYAVNRSRKSISSLMNIRADYANLWKDGKEVRVSPEAVGLHDLIVIKPGERVPLDGVIVEGTSSLDTSALTGESLPRDVGVQDEVLAGVVNLSGVLKVEVSKEYGESTVSRILELVENASSKKAPMEKFITRFAKVYTPTVVFLAIALVVLPMLFIPDAVFADWLYRALTFLVVSCPCALVISVPLGMFAGIGAASKSGILIKGGNYLEALKDIDTVVFDKTGTLTKGVFTVTQIHAIQRSEDELLEMAAYAENYSTHPIALSIRKAYAKTIDAERLSRYEEVAGNGIHVRLDQHELLVGNYKLMQANGITYEEHDALGTIVYIAVDGTYEGYIVIDDEIKETSKEAIASLKSSGVKKCVMLSGDRYKVGEHVASVLGLDEVHMQLLPADKVEKVEELLQQESEHGKLAFVGDGINDAPVLARADIGVAMGGIGSDAAIEAADVVLMKDDPSALSTAIRIAGKTMQILWQNIVFSLGIKVVILILTAFGMANMWMGVFADVGVTLIAILNSMRALKIR